MQKIETEADRPRPKPRWRPRKLRLELGAEDAAAIHDRRWFGEHPSRRYHARGGLVVRRCSGVHLRVADPEPVADNEADCETAWWRNAWPDLSPRIRDRLRRAARALAR